jgi:hypothetical protein
MFEIVKRHGRTIAAVVFLATACGGSTSPPSSASELGATACDHYVGALLGVTCNWGVSLPASEVARLQKTFAPVCQNAKQAPGSTLTDAQLDACASALEAQCAQLFVDPSVADACALRGSLAGGEPCSASTQCQSGFCGFPLLGTDADGGTGDGGLPAGACGVCVTPAAVGQPCPYGLCGAGASCQQDLTSAQNRCAADVPGGPQGACGQATGACQGNLWCDHDGGLCEPAPPSVGAGATCGDSAGNVTSPCKPGLYCGSTGTCTAPLPSGHECQALSDTCQLGLTCLGNECTVGTCSAPTWVDDGMRLTTNTSVCLHGSVSWCGGGGTCQTLVPNGQPCDPYSATTTCDDFSQCVNGTCQVVGALGCQNPLP